MSFRGQGRGDWGERPPWGGGSERMRGPPIGPGFARGPEGPLQELPLFQGPLPPNMGGLEGQSRGPHVPDVMPMGGAHRGPFMPMPWPAPPPGPMAPIGGGLGPPWRPEGRGWGQEEAGEAVGPPMGPMMMPPPMPPFRQVAGFRPFPPVGAFYRHPEGGGVGDLPPGEMLGPFPGGGRGGRGGGPWGPVAGQGPGPGWTAGRGPGGLLLEPAARASGEGAALEGRGPSRGRQNDYCQHFVDTGQRPQNFIRDMDMAERFEEYPRLKELISRKEHLIAERAPPPMYLHQDLRATELRPELFGTKFDVILIDPPWEEYVRRAPGVADGLEWWSPEEIMALKVEAIADTPSFLFLWVGDAEGLDKGRLCLKKWGFRRCEDICWIKTNRENAQDKLRHGTDTILHHSKEHCLMGIRGTVRRSTDGHIIHANIDTDIIISEEPAYGSTQKPEELYHIIEHFAQGRRRLELFGEDHNIRAGWLTVGTGLTSSNFNAETYSAFFTGPDGKSWQGGRGNPPPDAPHLLGTTPEIEALRPKSPTRSHGGGQHTQSGHAKPAASASAAKPGGGGS